VFEELVKLTYWHVYEAQTPTLTCRRR